MSVTILYSEYSYPIYEDLLDAYKDILPQEIKEKVPKFRRWQDRQAFILGKLLVWKGLKQFNYEDDCLSKLQFNSYGKPFIDQNIFFNLSHSGQIVICAFFKEEIGIDIEEIKEIEIETFGKIFTSEEKDYLKKSCNPTNDFFRFWTIKESVIKAVGKGLSIPLDLINASNTNAIKYDQTTWYIKEFCWFQNYCCSMATKFNAPPISFFKVEFQNKHFSKHHFSLKPQPNLPLINMTLTKQRNRATDLF